MFKKIKQLISIPKPLSLPMRMFCNEGDFTWEDWEEKAKKEHPIKYFLTENIPHWYRVHISMSIENIWYWIRTHTYNRYHKLDLRQPKTNTEDDYNWGWIEADNQLLFACFNILTKFVDNSNNCKYHYGTTDEDIKKLKEEIEKTNFEDGKVVLEDMLRNRYELRYLYHYWTTKRKDDLRKIEAVRTDWYKNKKKDGKEINDQKFKDLRKLEEDFYKEEEEALIRLIKVRRSLWT